MIDGVVSVSIAVLIVVLAAGMAAWFWIREFRILVKDLMAIIGSVWEAAGNVYAWLWRHWIARSLTGEVEGHLNKWIRELNRRMPVEFKVPEVNIRLHKTNRALEVLKDGKLLVFLNEDESAAERYAHATKFVVGALAMPPQHRPFFEPYICEAFELTVARLMLADRDPRALEAFERHAIQPAVKEDHRIARYCLRFETIQEAGFFTRILWPEMHDFAAHLQGKYPSRRLKGESARFIRWLHDMAARAPGDTSVPLQFMTRDIKVAFCLVRDNRRDLPIDVYERHISEDLAEGCTRVYVLAREQSIGLVMGIADKFRKDPRVARVLVHKFDQHMVGQSVLDEALKGAFQPPRGKDARIEYDKLATRYDEDDEALLQPMVTKRAICAAICAEQRAGAVLGDEFEELTSEIAAAGAWGVEEEQDEQDDQVAT